MSELATEEIVLPTGKRLVVLEDDTRVYHDGQLYERVRIRPAGDGERKILDQWVLISGGAEAPAAHDHPADYANERGRDF